MKTVFLLALAGAAFSASAQPLVVPIAYEALSGAVYPSDTLTRESARTHQQTIAAANLASIPIGSSITQITLRASNFGTVNALGSWPTTSLTYPVFEVYLARAARPVGGMSTVFAENVVAGSQVRVRQGALTIGPGSFSNFVAPPGANPWGLELQLSPFVYTGGDLVITIRHSGHQTAQTPRLYIDSLANTSAGMQCMAATGQNTTTGDASQSLPAIVRFRYIRPPSCVANCDGSTTSPMLTPNDFLCFINQFSAGIGQSQSVQVSSYANCDGSTSVPALNIGDFVCFNGRFAAGCP